VSFIDTSQFTRTLSRTWAAESAVAQTALQCVLNGETAIYASSELTSGRRVQALLRELGLKNSRELKERLGAAQYLARVLAPNVENGMAFARRLHHSLGGNQLVVTPAPFVAPDWTQPEYLGFWETIIRTCVKALYFNDGWELSDGCTFEFLVAADAGLPAFDARGALLDLEGAAGRIERAIADITRDGLDAQSLTSTLERLQMKRLIERHTGPM
jgi:hypothetical protein